jgi:uncharacterized protein (TIGR03437 family)
MRYKLLWAVVAAIPIVLLAYSTGGPIRMTGAPVDGGTDCSSCHNTYGPANSDPNGSVTITGLGDYIPGTVQELRVNVKHPSASRWGFQLTARTYNDLTQPAGSFVAQDSTVQVVCDDGSQLGSPAPCSGPLREFAEQTDAPRTPVGQGYSFNVEWIPPAQETGAILFYVSAVAADGDLTAAGDRVYTNSYMIQLSADASCSLSAMPTVRSAVNAGPHAGPFSPNSMVEVYGSNFQAGSRTRSITPSDLLPGYFPTVLSCVSVLINGVPAPITYIQQDQINIQAPSDTPIGTTSLTVVANAGKPNELRSAVATVATQAIAPSFFTFGTSGSIAAEFANTANIVANPSVVAGAQPAKPGDLITLYGTGFGPTSPSYTAGAIVSGVASTTNPVTVQIGDTILSPDDVLYAGLSPQSISGLYQINVRIPLTAPNGNLPVVATVAGVSSQTGATIPVEQ